MSKNVITTIVVAVVIGVVGFFGGMKYGQSKAQAAAPAAGTRTGAGAAGGAGRFAGRGGAGGGLVAGTILKQDSSSITVQLPGNGGTKLVLFSGSTTVGKIATGTPADLITGQNVIVTGTANSDGSVSATSIQIRPAGQGGFGGGQGGQSSSTPQ